MRLWRLSRFDARAAAFDGEGARRYPGRWNPAGVPVGRVFVSTMALPLLLAVSIFDLVANRRFWSLEGSIAPKPEKVETPAGKFDTFRVDATMKRVDRPNDRARPVHLWFTRDARRLPVAIVSEVDVGPVRAMLASVGGAR